jgi:polysaccharide biosynthesis PFTS motif protein
MFALLLNKFNNLKKKKLRETIRYFNFYKKNSYEINFNLFIKKILRNNFEINHFLSSYIFPLNKGVNYNNFYKQITVNNIINNKPFIFNLLRGIFYKKKISTNLSPDIQKICHQNLISINFILSSIFFKFFLIKQIFKSFKIVRNIIFFETYSLSEKKHLYFVDINKKYLLPKSDSQSYSIIDWFVKNNETTFYEEIRHSVVDSSDFFINEKKILHGYSPIPSIKSYKNKFDFFLWYLTSLIFCFFFIFTKKWVNCLLFLEAIYLKKLSYSDDKRLAQIYYFSTSSSTIRPLWTYLLKEKNSRAIHFSYSCSFFGIKNKNYYSIDLLNELNFWDVTLQFSSNIINHIKSINFVTLPKQVNPIYFTDSKHDIEIPSRSISIFDVEPNRKITECYNFKSLSFFQDITDERVFQFLNDIYDVSEELKIFIVWKQRWDTSNEIMHRGAFKSMSRKYINFSNEFQKRKNIFKINSYTSIFRIIPKTISTISFPFTSTGVIAKILKKPSLYYDPNNIIETDDRGIQSVEFASNKKDLKDWILKII